MFFNGDFRRKPEQSLGGAPNKNRDRTALLQNAKNERERRDLIRRKHLSAIKIQSYIRSHLARQKVKQWERQSFDEFLSQRKGSISNIEDLEALLMRLLFFWDSTSAADGNRLIALGQYILKNPQSVFNELVSTMGRATLWRHRLNRYLILCIRQLFVTDIPQAIPLRILELFTGAQLMRTYVTNLEQIRPLLEATFLYLVRNRYYEYMRRLLEEKVPPLDVPISKPPTPFCDAVLQLILRPLTLSSELFFTQVDRTLLTSFVETMLVPPMTEPIQLLLLPHMAEWDRLPFPALIRCCQDVLTRSCHQQQPSTAMDVDSDSAAIYTDRHCIQSPPQPPLNMSSSLLYAVLKLGQRHVTVERVGNEQKTDEESVLGTYLWIIAKTSANIWKLPRGRTQKLMTMVRQDHDDFHSSQEDDNNNDDDDDDDDDEYDDNEVGRRARERDILGEVVVMLNDVRLTDPVLAVLDSNQTDLCFVTSLCEICHTMMVFNSASRFEFRLLSQLSANTNFVRTVWHNISLQRSSPQSRFASPISLLSKGISVSQSDNLIPLLSTFCAVFSRLITTLHDDEFCGDSPSASRPTPPTKQSASEPEGGAARLPIMPFSVPEMIALSAVLKDICLGLVELAFPETRPINDHYRTVFHGTPRFVSRAGWSQQERMSDTIKAHLFRVCVHLLRQIYTRDLRRNFCPPNHWTVLTLNLPLDIPTDLTLQAGGTRRRTLRPFQPIRDFTREDVDSGPPLSTKQMRSVTILREIPFVVSFNERVNILQGLLIADKIKSQGELQNFLQGPSVHIKIRRSHLYEDSFDKLSLENEPDLKPKLKVQMVNAIGLDEAGVDGGGIFREFLSELIKTAFDPHRGFFMMTTDNKLYPNPSVGKIVENYQKHYFFIGRVLGKALYDNLLVELPLADFFLSKLAGKHSDADIHQLASLDPVLHKNLLSLKAYDGDVSELGLDFTVVSNELGETKVEELKSGGSNIAVTASNRIEYIHLMADYKINKQIRKQCAAFREGLKNVLPIEWLFMFSNLELQVLISGAEIPVDTVDLRKHTNYGGNFSNDHPTIKLFWSVVEEFTDIEKRLLLKFVTSCSRPPLLGFKDLEPPFTIQDAVDTDRLPSSSTCMNLLKLPPFQSAAVLREKIIYAINSETGFELS